MVFFVYTLRSIFIYMYFFLFICWISFIKNLFFLFLADMARPIRIITECPRILWRNCNTIAWGLHKRQCGPHRVDSRPHHRKVPYNHMKQRRPAMIATIPPHTPTWWVDMRNLPNTSAICPNLTPCIVGCIFNIWNISAIYTTWISMIIWYEILLILFFLQIFIIKLWTIIKPQHM